MESKDKEFLDYQHKLRMEQIEKEFEFRFKLEGLIFDHNLQLQRIKSAEIRKNLERKH